ncbi:MAG: hypothetical protein ABSA21_09300 [Candidatus Limnocylindrales bacterium]
MADQTPAGGVPDQARVVQLLDELLAWTRFTARPQLVETLGAVLKDPKHLRAFEATDGEAGQNEVALFAGLSQPAVSKLWARWSRLGLLVDRGKKPMHLARPSDLGIEIPDLDRPAVKSEGAAR